MTRKHAVPGRLNSIQETAEFRFLSSHTYLTPNQVAERLQVSVEYLYRELLGHAEGIPALKLGSGPRARWRIKLIDLEAWEQRQRVCYGHPSFNGERQ